MRITRSAVIADIADNMDGRWQKERVTMRR